MRFCFAVVLIIFSTWLTNPVLAADRDIYDCEHISDYNRTITACTRFIESGRESADAHYNRGTAYHMKHDYNRAIADQTAAIRLEPKSWYHLARGNSYRAKGDYDRAIADYTEAIRIEPKIAHFFEARSRAYKAKGDNDRALADHKEAIRLDPEFGR